MSWIIKNGTTVETKSKTHINKANSTRIQESGWFC